MAETHLNAPGEVTWLKGNTPVPVVGPCPHSGCQHETQSVVAWGPDLDRYELVACDVAGQCAGRCRAWSRPSRSTDRAGKPLMSTSWLLVAPPPASTDGGPT